MKLQAKQRLEMEIQQVRETPILGVRPTGWGWCKLTADHRVIFVNSKRQPVE
jgi:hypothetical protein